MMLVKDIMAKKLVMVGPRESVYAVVKLMVQNNISGIVVEDGKRAVGVVTMKDIMRRVLAEDKDVYRTTVSEIMTSPVLTIGHENSVEAAASYMGERRIKRLVVVDGSNRAVGILTVMDLVSNLPNLLNVMFETWVKPEWR